MLGAGYSAEMFQAMKSFLWRAVRSPLLWLIVLLLAWGSVTSASVFAVRAAMETLQGVTRAGPSGFGGAPTALDEVTTCCQFDLLAWEARGIGRWFLNAMQPQARQGASADAIQDLERFFALSRALLYAELARDNPSAEQTSAAQLAAQRAEQEALRPTAQTTVIKLVGQQLSAEGLGTWFPGSGYVPFPPVAVSLVPPPNVLVVSPRDRIFLERSILLAPALTFEQVLQMESNAEAQGWSVLVEPTGGYSSYPTIVSDRATLGYALQSVAHEWSHTYLFFRPLGFNYFRDPQMRVINETVANLIGREIGRSIREVYYPRPAAQPSTAAPSGREAPAFNFRAEMRETRLEAERLLALGNIEEAESYMEQRRLVLVEHGYRIRKLNQAYFAFHGSYADAPSSGSVSPIAPQLIALRERAATVKEFIETVSSVSSPQDFQALLEREGLSHITGVP